MIHHLGRGLSLELPHDLPHQEAEGLLLAAQVVLHRFGVGGQYLLHHLAHQAGVGDLLQAVLSDIGVYVAVLGKDGIEDLHRRVPVDLSLLDQGDEPGQSLRGKAHLLCL